MMKMMSSQRSWIAVKLLAPSSANNKKKGAASQQQQARYSVQITCRVQPNTSREGVDVPKSDAEAEVRVRVSAPPVEGKANAAVCDAIEELMRAAGVASRTSNVQIVSGSTSKSKVVAFEFASSAEDVEAEIVALMTQAADDE
jgi:uncharacterized protein (TIGR00251 family)